MRVPVKWLQNYVNFEETPAELAARLTMAGLEVEQIESEGEEEVLEVKVTPNRGDCLSMIGIAREVSAFTGKPLMLPRVSIDETATSVEDLVSVEVLASSLCPRYSARVLMDVKIGPSPEWMQKRLIEAGMRPINNVVDATNYVMLEMGQPLHAFDYDLVAGHRIIVRKARDGEKITTIDGVEHTLTPEILVIADTHQALAIAGVMGGSNSEVHDGTTRILLESAHFDAVSNRKASKVLGFRTEASYRFERYVDPEGTICAAHRAAQLIQETSGAKIAAGVVDVYPGKKEEVKVLLRPERCNQLLAIDVSAEKQAEMLKSLGFDVLMGEKLSVSVPSWRPDVTKEIDLIEEVGRIYGYNNIPTTLPCVEIVRGRDSLYGEVGDRVKEILTGYGLDEVMTHSLVSPRSQELMVDSVKPVAIRSPLSADLSVLRTSLIPNLLALAQRNAGAGAQTIRVFEIGSVFAHKLDDESDVYEEWREVSGLMMGPIEPSGWVASKKPAVVDFFHVKGIVESLLSELGIKSWNWDRFTHPVFHPGRCAKLMVGDLELGVIGEVHPSVAKQYDLPERAYLFGLRFTDLADMVGQKEFGYKPLPKFPAVTRDLASVFAETIATSEIASTIKNAGGELVEDVRLFDVYTGASIPQGSRSLAFSIVLRALDRTLTDEEAAQAMERIKAALVERHGASFRG